MTDLPARFGKYQLLERIGVGGMAEIFKAKAEGPSGFEKTLVIKRILPELANNRAFIQLLVGEAKVTSLLDHPNIVQIYELGEAEGQYYIAMELVDGTDLLNLLSRCTRERLRIPIEIALHIVSEVCRGLAHAHAANDTTGRPLNVIHRDVSPSNVLLSKTGDVKIMDFGVARADLGLQTPEHERGVLKGKLGYMSPEQVTGKNIDRRSDIFALGVMLFECLTLKRLFVGANDVQTLLNVREADVEPRFKRHSYLPKPIRALLRKALAREPEDRFQTATDFQEAVLDYLFDSRLKVSSRSLAQFLDQVAAAAGDLAGASTEPLPPLETSSVGEDLGESAADAPQPEANFASAAREGTPHLPPVPLPSAVSLRPKALRRVDLSRATFQFKHDDGVIFGPVDFERLLGLLMERAVSGREWVSVNGSDWLRVAEVPSIVELMPALFEDDPSRPLDDGPMHRLRTPSLYLRIARERWTGKLRATTSTLAKEFYFDHGTPRFSHSNLKTDLYGNFLVRQGVVADVDVMKALEKVQAPHTHLGQVLVEAGAMTEAQRVETLAGHLRSRLLETLGWRTGWYEFYEGILPPRDETVSKLALGPTIMDGLRHHYGLAELQAIFQSYMDRPIILGPDAAIVGERLAFLPEEERLRQVLQTGGLLSETTAIMRRSQSAQQLLLRVAFALQQSDVLAVRKLPPAPTPPAPAS